MNPRCWYPLVLCQLAKPLHLLLLLLMQLQQGLAAKLLCLLLQLQQSPQQPLQQQGLQ